MESEGLLKPTNLNYESALHLHLHYAHCGGRQNYVFVKLLNFTYKW